MVGAGSCTSCSVLQSTQPAGMSASATKGGGGGTPGAGAGGAVRGFSSSRMRMRMVRSKFHMPWKALSSAGVAAGWGAMSYALATKTLGGRGSCSSTV